MSPLQAGSTRSLGLRSTTTTPPATTIRPSSAAAKRFRWSNRRKHVDLRAGLLNAASRRDGFFFVARLLDGEAMTEIAGISAYPARPVTRFSTATLGYFDLEQKTLQPLDNPFGTRLSPMS
jgi:hypothetical protein